MVVVVTATENGSNDRIRGYTAIVADRKSVV